MIYTKKKKDNLHQMAIWRIFQEVQNFLYISSPNVVILSHIFSLATKKDRNNIQQFLIFPS